MIFRRVLASLVSIALVSTAPGFAAYAAAGEIARSAPASFRGGAAIGVPPAPLSGLANLGALSSLSLPDARLGGVSGELGVPAGIPAPGGALAPAALDQEARPGLMRFVAEAQDPLAPAAPQLAAQDPGQARSTGFRIVDRLLGRTSARSSSEAFDAGGFGGSTQDGGLAPRERGDGSLRPEPPAPRGPNGSGPRSNGWLRALAVAGRVALASGAVLALQAGAVALAPALFGVAPVAAVWAVASGALILPGAVYTRYLLSKRDSASLKKTKWALDFFIGAYLGAAGIAAPAFSVAVALQAAAIGVPLTAAAGVGSVLASQSGGRTLDLLMAAGALAFLPALFGVAAAGVIGVGSIIGMAALPAMTTIAFFLGKIVVSAETGRPFTLPGAMQKVRFPSFNWIMIGVVFALLSGYGAVHSNIAFMVWTFTGSKTGSKWDKSKPAWKNALGAVMNFNVLWGGLLLFAAATGFASPLTFLVLAFLPERAAHWTERLLGRFYRQRAAAPSTTAKPADDQTFIESLETNNPELSHWLKTGLLLSTMLAVGFTMATFVFGAASLLKNLAIAAVLAGLPFFFSNKLVKLVMKAQPTTQARDPEFWGIMTELREKINIKRVAGGKKPIPMPEMVNVPMDVPNAFATGRSPFKATVGVTDGIKRMLLSPRDVRSQLALLISSVEPGSKSFRIFRRGIAGSISGVSESSSADELSQALERATDAEVSALGARMLRGVLGHELMHVMDRHMLTGAVTGALSSGVAFSSYGVMWGVGHAQALALKIRNAVLGKKREPAKPDERAADPGARDEKGGPKPEALDPISTGIVLKSLPALLRMLAALWGPVIMSILQMTASRNNESQADTDGAALTEDPESLALALGMLMTWRPPEAFTFPVRGMPRLAALQHLFTVNPLQQLDAAGKLPLKEAAVLGKRENWLFNLFITHPDTRVRIENLFDHSERMRRRPPAPPADSPPMADSGGGPAPPLAFVPQPDSAPTFGRGVFFPGIPSLAPAPESSEGRSGPFQRAWVKAASLWRVLPDEDRNAEYWKFVLGQALITLGAFFHYTALPKLSAPTKADAARMGYNRAVNSGSQALSSLVSGAVVDRVGMRTLLIWTHLGRAVLMLSVPVLFFHGYLVFGMFLLVIFGAGFLQNMSITAGSVAFNRILGPHTSYYNRANAVFNLVVNVTGIVGPLAAGAFIGAMDARYGLLAGNALAYGFYGLMLLAVAVGYGLFLKVPKAIKAAEAGAVRAKTRALDELFEGFRVIWRSRYLRRYMLLGSLALFAGDSLVFTALPRYIEDVLGSGAPAVAGALSSVPVLGAAVSGLLSKSGAFGLYLAASSTGMFAASLAMAFARDKPGKDLIAVGARLRAALETFSPRLSEEQMELAVDALAAAPRVVLERYAEAWRAEPRLERTAAGLARDVMALAAETAPAEHLAGARAELEAWAAAHWPRLEKSARKTARTGLDELQRQGRWSSILQGFGWLAYLGVFLYGGLLGSVAAMAVALLLQGPAAVVWASLNQKAIAEAAPDSMGKVYSAMFFLQLVLSIAGVLVFGWLLSVFATGAALLIVSAVAAACALLAFIVPFVVFSRPARDR